MPEPAPAIWSRFKVSAALAIPAFNIPDKWDSAATPSYEILRQTAKRDMRSSLAHVTVADCLATQPLPTNLPKTMPASIKKIGVSNLQISTTSMTLNFTLAEISEQSKNCLDK